MKNITTLLFCCLCILFVQAKQTKILWLGNSYTYVNDLPTMFHDLALSGGDTVIFDSYTIGGYTLKQQAQDTNAQNKIKARQWDYVVIQAQSQEPSFPASQFNTQTLPYAITLDSLVHVNNPCTQTVFYMTWGKKHGDTGNCSGFPVLCTFDGVTSQLRQGYLTMADTTHAITAPVGMAWSMRWHTDTLINLWQTDDSHPLVPGTYLAACTFYATIFGKSPVGLSFTASLAQSIVDTLQLDAARTVFDSLTTWNVGVYNPHASFTFTVDTSTKTVDVVGIASTNYTTLSYDFGDGSGLSHNATHTYTDSGTYTIKLIAMNNCAISDTAVQTVQIRDTIATADTTVHTGVDETLPAHYTIAPNPTDGVLMIAANISQAIANIQVIDCIGQIVMMHALPIAPKSWTIDVSALSKGIYLVKIGTESHRFLKL